MRRHVSVFDIDCLKGGGDMPDLLIPEQEDLNYHDCLMKHGPTLHGIRIVPGTDPTLWKEDWRNSERKDRIYRLIFCEGCGYYVGEAAYRKTEGTEANLWLLIDGDLRREGYGAAVLKKLAKMACESGIRTFAVCVYADHPNLDFFRKRGFQETDESEGVLTLKADTELLSRCRCHGTACSLHAQTE